MSDKPGNINKQIHPYEYQEFPKFVDGKIVNSQAELDALAPAKEVIPAEAEEPASPFVPKRRKSAEV